MITPDALPPLPTFCECPKFVCGGSKFIDSLPTYSAQAVISKGHIYVSRNNGFAHLQRATDFKLAEGGIKGQTVSPCCCDSYQSLTFYSEFEARITRKSLQSPQSIRVELGAYYQRDRILDEFSE